jgi:hypothetical protein
MVSWPGVSSYHAHGVVNDELVIAVAHLDVLFQLCVKR